MKQILPETRLAPKYQSHVLDDYIFGHQIFVVEEIFRNLSYMYALGFPRKITLF